MAPNPWKISSFLSVFIIILALADGDKIQAFHKNLATYKTIVVDKSGSGDFRSIQSAINSIPPNNQHWICIFVKAGIYREKVEIPVDKPLIFLKGEGKKRSYVVWSDHLSITQSATFSLFADNFVAKGISFMNSYNLPVLKNGNPRKPAVAALVFGDKASFYRCGFYGVQDTLWDVDGRHYFNNCTIQGAVDFIFGAGQSIYENCVISVVGRALEIGVPGFITAQGREDGRDSNGFVFKSCRVKGNGEAYLGRPWRGFSRVIFYRTFLSNIIVPAGWDPWNYAGNERFLTYAEQECYGEGADTSERVDWEKKLSPSAVTGMTSINFIDADSWLFSQP